MNTTEILKKFNDELHHYLDRNANSNDSKAIFTANYFIDRIPYLDDTLDYEPSFTPQGFIHKGFLEVIYLQKHGIKATKVAPSGVIDLPYNKFYTEFKCFINPSNAPEIKLNQLEKNGGYIIATREGIYRITSEKIKAHANELSHRQGKTFLTIPWVRKYATLTNEKF